MGLLDHEQAARSLIEQTNEEIKKMTPLHILIVGKSGVGKSTLINSVFREQLATTGIGKPVTSHLTRIEKEGVPIVLYDTRGLELNEMVQEQVKEEIFQQIEHQKNTKERINIVYYCIHASSNRIESIEIEWINELAKHMPVILLLTQAIGTQVDNFVEYLEHLNLPIASIQPVLAQDFSVNEDYIVKSFGLDQLINETWQLIPKEVKDSFNNAQQIDIRRKVKSAQAWSKKYIAMTFGIGFIPIPFSDASVLVPMQITLLAHITAIFGIPMEYSTVASIIGAVGGTGSATYLGKSIVANTFKMIPGVGTVVGGLISGGTAAIITTALANSYIMTLKLIAQSQLKGESLPTKKIIQLVEKEFKKQLSKKEKELKKESQELRTESKKNNIEKKFKNLLKNFNTKQK